MFNANYPKSIYLILSIEFFERFSFCGLRTMLSLYLRDVLHFSEKDATILYHVFYALCYLVPIFGAILADSFYGRYRTIRLFSVVYVLGTVLLYLGAVSSFHLPPVRTTLLGLLFIGIGSGGIKPCVAALCGEQFYEPEHKFYLERFFSVYYFVITIGGFLGTIFIPMLRKTLPCHGEEPCYVFGFAVPAVLMILALLLFVVGKPMYRIRTHKKNIILQFLKCIIYSLSKKLESDSSQKKAHWLDYAEGEYSPRLISDMKTVFSILFVFIPLPLFWSLFDQLGSSWTFQAARTDSQIFGIYILPDQMQVISPMLSLICIPLFDNVIYPALDKLHILENPLRRMLCGGCIAGFAFLCAGYVELNLQGVSLGSQSLLSSKLVLINTLPCSVSLVNDINFLDDMESGDVLTYGNVTQGNYSFNVIAPQDCGTLSFKKRANCALKFTVEAYPDINSIAIMCIQNHKISMNLYQESFLTPSGRNSADSQLSQYLNTHSSGFTANLSGVLNLTANKSLVPNAASDTDKDNKFSQLLIHSPGHSISLVNMLPQYVLMSIAEVMFAIAGLHFSFTQAPRTMKTVTIATWQLSVALGNIIIICVEQLRGYIGQAGEFFLYACLIFVDMLLFFRITNKYKFKRMQLEDSSNLLLAPTSDANSDILFNVRS